LAPKQQGQTAAPKWRRQNVRVRYYYACVVRIGKIETVCPITDIVSAAHDKETVTEWLKCLKELIIASVWPPFKNVVTDFSWAFMHGIIKKQYLNTWICVIEY